MDFKKIILGLHPLEKLVIPAISKNSTVEDIMKKCGLQEIEVTRAIQWLENKNIVKTTTDIQELIELDVNGKKYSINGLPERNFLKAIKNKPLKLDEVQKAAKLEKPELNVCIGLLKKKLAIEMGPKGISITPQGEKILNKEWLEESFLKKLKNPINKESLSPEEIFSFDVFTKRKNIVKTNIKKTKNVMLTNNGEKIAKENLNIEVIDSLNPKILKNGDWKTIDFRRYDVSINVPKIYGGRKHFVNEAVEYISSIWLEMGFKEMDGPMVESAFWDLDALFVPQDHPAREMQDTFYLHGVSKLPKLVDTIKKIHETGGNTGSKGWKNTFSKKEASQVMLRTHTTSESAHTLSKLKKEDLPAKFFSVGKVFRNEALDWKHLFEFYQVEGIVVDPNANLKHLKGYLKDFYKKMGYEKVRLRPAHFPYTEPSLEVDAFHPIKKEWIELGGAGILRPEVVIPLLGFDCPVLAWGQGMGRIISEFWGITDIRDLYKNDLKQLKEMKSWVK